MVTALCMPPEEPRGLIHREFYQCH